MKPNHQPSYVELTQGIMPRAKLNKAGNPTLHNLIPKRAILPPAGEGSVNGGKWKGIKGK